MTSIKFINAILMCLSCISAMLNVLEPTVVGLLGSSGALFC